MQWDKPVNFNAENVTDGGPIDRVVMSILIVLGIYILSRRVTLTRRLLNNNKLVLLLFAYMGLSIVWSNFPAVSFVRYGRTVGALIMALVVLTELAPLDAIHALLFRIYVLHVTLSFLTIKYFRNIGVFYDWSGQYEDWIGLSTDKNSLGQVMMCSGIFWLWRLFGDWPNRKLRGKLRVVMLDLGLLALTLWMLKGSKTVHSSTSIVGFAVSATILIGLQFLRGRSARAKRIVVTLCMGVMLIGPSVYLVFQTFGTTPVKMVVKATGRDMTFTDRNRIWTDVLNISERDPLFGVGIGALWVGPIGYELYPMPNWSAKTPQWRPEEAHNGYIDTYAQIGLVGLALLSIVIWRALSGALDDLQMNFWLGCLRLPLLIGILINNMAESSFLLGTHDLWFLFLVLGLNLPKPRRVLPPHKVESSAQSTDEMENALAPAITVSNALHREPSLLRDPARVSYGAAL